MSEQDDNCKLEEKHLELTWKWFEYHANQRMQTFYYFLLIIGALSWGFYSCYSNDSLRIQMLSPFIALLAVIIAIAFFFIEIRNVELVNIGRNLLIENDYDAAIIDKIENTSGDSKNGKYECYLRIKKDALGTAIGEKFPSSVKKAFENLAKHELWLRLIYLVSFLYALGAFVFSLPYLKDGYVYVVAVLQRLIIVLVLFAPIKWFLLSIFVVLLLLVIFGCLFFWKRNSCLLKP